MTRAVRGWVLPACAALLVGACAHIEAPTGGPEDKQGPQLLVTRPDTFARVPNLRTPAVFVFDEGVSEEGLEAAVTVSPRTSAVAVDNDGGEVRVSLRRGWEPNRVYQVVLDSTVRDRFNNRIPEGIRLVFSTGAAIPETFLSGTVLERQTARPATGVRVEAILRADSLVYATRTDAQGTFAFAQIPEGEYQVRAFNDPNANRSLEPFEARDTTVARVAAGQQPAVSLSIVAPDTTAPRPLEATPADTLVTVRFDDFLDPAQRLAATQVMLLAPDSTPVRVAAVTLGEGAAPSAPATSAAGDTSRAARTAARDSTLRDTSRAAPSAPVPGRTLVVRLAAPLRPETEYTLRVTGVRNLVGLAGDGTIRFRTPRAAPPAPRPAAPVAGTPPAGTTPPAATPPVPTPPARPAPTTAPPARP